ncbi:hypothetical protein MKX08_008110 [Trichoderma sp. CBMAI-0020]|nr:hypothetical protein MKX08_008110 [Trichoderma sp. CBMAI-0020]
MGPERLTAVSNNDKAVNVGSSQRIQHQDASIGSNAKTVHTGYESRDITVNYNKITHDYAPTSELPYRGNIAAGYVKNYLVSPDDDINWSKRSQDFVTRNEAEHESSEIDLKWQKTISSVQRLNGEIAGFLKEFENISWLA